MSGFGFDPAGENALADFGLVLVDAAPVPARVVTFPVSRRADRVASFATARRAQRVVTFEE